MNAYDLKERTMKFAERVLRMVDRLPKTVAGQTVARQVARSGTSVAANYRAALRNKSRADFVNKITIVLEEADETGFWIELAGRVKLLPEAKLGPLRDEAEQLSRIFNATRRTARNH
ncbi:MAG: four helix bundle protein [Methyloceanibacter sp.]|nr:four helix bundle protein [Methyloceanibacter sp.]